MPLADAHVHIFATGFPGLYGRPCSGGDDLEVYESFRQAHDIDVALVVGFEGVAECAGNNRHVAELALVNHWIVPVEYTLVDAPHLPTAPFVGISVYLSTPAEAQRFANWSPAIQHELSSREIVVSLNAAPDALAIAEPALRNLEGCRILISHLGEPGAYAEPPTRKQAAKALEPLASLSTAPHIGVKLSGLYAVSKPAHDYPHVSARPFIDELADAFGTERLYWGSDFSPALDYVSFAQTISAVRDLAWSDSEREAVMGANLRRLLRRPDVPG